MEVGTILRRAIKSTLLAANVRRSLRMGPFSGASTPLTAIPLPGFLFHCAPDPEFTTSNRAAVLPLSSRRHPTC
jgi:hypothetical protein